MGIVGQLAVLCYFKYYNFFVDGINDIFCTSYHYHFILIPLGISFITFQQIAFLTDAYRGELSVCSFCDYMLFILFFPHITAGPIIFAKDFFQSLSELKRKVQWGKIAEGIYLFAMGLGKKVLIADTFAKAVDWGYSNIDSMNTVTALFVSVAYTIQIYFDFSGYSDMAIGISRMLQFDLPINFNSPYKAVTIEDFWDRWHISLTKFLTRYLYIPLGGNRKGQFRTYLNIFIVFLCSGFWHGASWAFVAWGMLHGIFMIITRRFAILFEKIPRWINRIITLLFVNFTWILFRAGSLGVARKMLMAILFGGRGTLDGNVSQVFCPILLKEMDTLYIWFAAVAVLLAFFMIFGCKNVSERVDRISFSPLRAVWVVVVLVWSTLSFSGVSSFIYSMF